MAIAQAPRLRLTFLLGGLLVLPLNQGCQSLSQLAEMGSQLTGVGQPYQYDRSRDSFLGADVYTMKRNGQQMPRIAGNARLVNNNPPRMIEHFNVIIKKRGDEVVEYGLQLYVENGGQGTVSDAPLQVRIEDTVYDLPFAGRGQGGASRQQFIRNPDPSTLDYYGVYTFPELVGPELAAAREIGYRFTTELGERNEAALTDKQRAALQAFVRDFDPAVPGGADEPAEDVQVGAPSATTDPAPASESTPGRGSETVTAACAPVPPPGREQVRWVQSTLNSQGYACGVADGLMGRNTRACIGAYQRAEGLLITDEADATTLENLACTAPSSSTVEVFEGLCQGEGCVSEGTAMLSGSAIVHPAPGARSAPIRRVEAGTSVTVLRRQYHATPRRFEITRAPDYRLWDMARGRQGPSVRVGEVIDYITWAGEGNSFVRYRGKLYTLDLQEYTDTPIGRFLDPEVPDGVTWVQVRLPDGTAGWLSDPPFEARF